MSAQDSPSGAQQRAEGGWQWVPVRLDLHQRLAETPHGEVVVTGSGPERDREQLLMVLREQNVPVLYSSSEQTLELMLPVSTDDDEPRLAQATTEGELALGAGLEEFMERLLAFPGLEYASWRTGGDESEEITAVLLVRLPVTRLRRRLRRLCSQGWWESAPVEEGSSWSLAAAEHYEDLLELVDGLCEEAVLLDAEGGNRALSVIPSQEEPITVEWGPVRSSIHTYPVESPAQRLQSQVSGQGAHGLRETVRAAAVAVLTERFGLDRASARRLDHYTQDGSGRYAPESVLQLLGLPDLPAKILDGRRRMEQMPGYERTEGDQESSSEIDQTQRAASAEPQGRSQDIGGSALGRALPAAEPSRLSPRVMRAAAAGAAAAIGWGVGTWLGRRGR